MQAKKILAILAVAVVVLIIFVFLQPVLFPSPKESIENPDYVDPGVLAGTELPEDIPAGIPVTGVDCELQPRQSSKDYCYSIQAQDTNSVQPCLQISTLAEKNSCIKVLAMDTADISFCNYTESAYYPNDNSNVKYSCISAVAEDFGDETICNAIPSAEWKTLCIQRVQEYVPLS
ncbi:MAG TPA: hypothetical protein VI977_04065 [archaeon]|nr:hypothetical protein [archaeon]